MKYILFPTQERMLYQADGVVTVDFSDLAKLAAGNTGSIKLAPYGGGDGVGQPFTDVASPPQFPAGVILQVKSVIVDTAFTFSDGTLTSCTAVLGDGGSSNRYLTASELAAGNTPITQTIGTGTRFQLTAADSLILALTGTSAKNINTATVGSLRVYFKAEDTGQWPKS